LNCSDHIHHLHSGLGDKHRSFQRPGSRRLLDQRSDILLQGRSTCSWWYRLVLYIAVYFCIPIGWSFLRTSKMWTKMTCLVAA